jgi:hypothetical protein|tara:strand:- start:53 stop:451 length:399 start_codon:yes stop_codon:yes gene_type:complete
MTSVLNVDTIADKAGTGPVGLTKQSAAKAWVNFDQSDNGIDGSLNIASVTDNAVGDITLNFTNAFSGDTFAPSGFAGFASSYGQTVWVSGPANVAIGSWKTSSLLRAQASYANATKNSDVEDFNLICNGDLA